MQQAGKAVSAAGEIVAQAADLILEFDVANMDFGVGQQLSHGLPPLVATDDIDDLRADLFERLGHMPGDAFFVRDAEDEQRFAGELKKVVHRRATSLRFWPE